MKKILFWTTVSLVQAMAVFFVLHKLLGGGYLWSSFLTAATLMATPIVIGQAPKKSYEMDTRVFGICIGLYAMAVHLIKAMGVLVLGFINPTNEQIWFEIFSNFHIGAAVIYMIIMYIIVNIIHKRHSIPRHSSFMLAGAGMCLIYYLIGLLV